MFLYIISRTASKLELTTRINPQRKIEHATLHGLIFHAFGNHMSQPDNINVITEDI